MATIPARFTSLCNALVDGTATVAQQTAIANGYVWQVSDDELMELFGVARAALTNAQKAQIGFRGIAREVKRNVRAAAEQVQAASNDAAITSAGDAAVAGL